jgi:CO/xanthine dehydrogenase Mo-binding subunit
LKARVLVDNGIFSFHHGGIVATLLGGYYRWPNLKIDAFEVQTHKLQVGAYRAPGAPQATFAVESSMDDLARELGIDPLELRLKNASVGGDPTGSSDSWPEGIGIKKVLERLKEHPLWQNRQEGEGIGVALGGWPTAAGSAEALCRVDSDGTVRVSVGTVDISGVNSGFALVVAETLGVSPDKVVIEGTGTDGAYGPGSGGSQVTYSTAPAVRQAAFEARAQLVKVAAEMFEAAEADIDIIEGQAQVRGVPGKAIPLSELVKRGRRNLGAIAAEGKSPKATNAPGFVAHLIKIDVDKVTGVVTPRHYVTVQDVGFAINPLLVEGQMHGGAVQGLGYALHEAIVFDSEGNLLTTGFSNYSLPRSDNIPEIETILVENPSPQGPFGARGVGEPPITAGAAAVANAIKDACGVRLTEIPIRQEAVWRALRDKEGI